MFTSFKSAEDFGCSKYTLSSYRPISWSNKKINSAQENCFSRSKDCWVFLLISEKISQLLPINKDECKNQKRLIFSASVCSVRQIWERNRHYARLISNPTVVEQLDTVKIYKNEERNGNESICLNYKRNSNIKCLDFRKDVGKHVLTAKAGDKHAWIGSKWGSDRKLL